MPINFLDVLGMKRVVAKFVSKLLNFDPKNSCLSITQELLNDVDPDLLKKVITDDTWVYGYDVETKTQSSQWRHFGLPRLKKTKFGQM